MNRTMYCLWKLCGDKTHYVCLLKEENLESCWFHIHYQQFGSYLLSEIFFVNLFYKTFNFISIQATNSFSKFQCCRKIIIHGSHRYLNKDM